MNSFGGTHDGDSLLIAELCDPATDADLAARFRHDPAQFATVHDRYFRDIYRYVAGRLGLDAAEDVAAETFLVAFDRRERFDAARGELRAWLFGIATKLIARHRRREARHLRALGRLAPERPSDGHERRVVAAVAAQRLQPRLAKALRRLSPGERDVLLLVALGQLSYEEVADALGIAPGTVGSRLGRARSKLDNAIGQEAVDG